MSNIAYSWMQSLQQDLDGINENDLVLLDAEMPKTTEVVIGEAPLEARRLYVLSRRYADEMKNLSIAFKTGSMKMSRKEAEEKSIRLMKLAEQLLEMFWVAVKEAYPELWKPETISVRRDWQIVTHPSQEKNEGRNFIHDPEDGDEDEEFLKRGDEILDSISYPVDSKIEDWLGNLRQEMSQLNESDLRDSNDEGEKDELVLCTLDDECKRLFTLTQLLTEKVLRHELDSQKLLGNRGAPTHDDRANAVTKAKLEALSKIFWVMVRDKYDLSSQTIIMRSGWRVVRGKEGSDNPIERLFKQLNKRLG
jgi:hypothetical protein